MKKARALILFSGGLDSILASLILKEQKIKLLGITFKSYFFSEEQAKKVAREINLRLKIIDFSEKHSKIVKKPKYGYGRNLNPCIDCHILMLKKTKEIMKKKKFDFVATGEVLAERPMSQSKKNLLLIRKKSSLNNYLLRPLSAKLLEPTVPEKKGLVNREKLLAIAGRSRKEQIKLAKKYGLKEYPTPAGGCLLTDSAFSQRLKDLLQIYPKCSGNDIQLLKYGRHFWQDKTKIIIGRHKEENEKIKKLAQNNDILIEMKNYPGPLTLIRNYGKNKVAQVIVEKAKKMTQNYSNKAKNKPDVKFKINL